MTGLLLGSFSLPVKADKGEPEIKAIRKVLIVPKGQIERGIEMSKELGVPEVAEGIPPALEDKVTEDMLPYVYEEIIYEEEKASSTEQQIKDIEKRLDIVEKALKKLGADIAEYYPVADESIEAGDVVSVSNQSGLIMSVTSTKYLVEKSSQPYDQKLIGVISSDSAVIINSGDGSNPEAEAMLRPVALTGRVPVKVSLENGPIEIGDYLTSSGEPGIAMKATKAGKTIGMALENFDESVIGKIMVFVNVDWYGGEIEEGFSITGTFSNLFNSILGQFKKIGVFIEQNLVRVKRIITVALVIEKAPTPEESTIGEGVVLSGTNEITIYNNNIKPTSKIFITFRGDYQGRWWASEIAEGYFKIALSEVPLQNTSFDYWIVGVEESWIPSAAEPVCENGANRPCSSEIGACRIGVQICEGGQWGACIGAVFPTEEIDDDVDNDCDGEIDEGLISGSPTSPTSENQEVGLPNIGDAATSTDEILQSDSGQAATTTEQ